MTLVYSVMFLFSLSGNAMILHIVLSRPYMRSVTNSLIANMAIADLLMTLSAMPYSAVYSYVQSRWFGGIMGMITCKLLHFSVTLSIAASILTLIVIALDRFVAVAYPFKRLRSVRKISATSCIIWIVSVILTSPYLYCFKTVLQKDGNYYCFIMWEPLADTLTASRIYFSFFFISLYVVPLFVTAIFYSIISFKLWFRQIPGNPTAANLRNAELGKRRMIRMLITVVIVFALCWLPAHLMHYFNFFDEKRSREIPALVYLTAFGVSHANSAINPYIYIALSKNFRRAFLDVIRSCFNPAGNLVRPGESDTTSQTNLTRGMSLEYITAFGRRGVYELSNTEQNGDLPCARQIDLLKVTERETK